MLEFKPSEDIISMSEFRTKLADCVVRAADTRRPIIITQNGRACSVFLSVAEWEKISQRLYDAEIYEDFIVGESETANGDTNTSDEVKRIIEEDLRKRAPKSKGKKRTQKLAVA